jgi:hypothetical protein
MINFFSLEAKSMDDSREVVKGTRKELEQVIKKYEPTFFSAYELTQVLFKMLNIEFYGFTYPNISVHKHKNMDKIDVMIDFSDGCAFFIKQKPIYGGKYHVSVNVPEEFDYPVNLDESELETWLPQIIYQNHLFEQTAED